MFTKILALAAVLGAASAQAYEGPWITRVTTAGYVAPGYNHSTSCELWTGRILFKVTSEGVTVTETREFQIQGDLQAKIAGAAKGQIKSESAPVDGPGLTYTAYTDASHRIDLANDNGGNGVKTTNISEEAIALRNLMDLLCK